MNLRKVYKEFRDLKKVYMVDPTEEDLKNYYNGRNAIGLMVLEQEHNRGFISRMFEILHKKS